MAITTAAALRASPSVKPGMRGVYASVSANSTPFVLGTCIGLNVAVAGTATVVDVGGNAVQLYLTQGWNPYPCSQINAAAATGLVAVY